MFSYNQGIFWYDTLHGWKDRVIIYNIISVFFPSLSGTVKRDPFTIRNGPSQFPNGPFNNWIKISHYESKHCNNFLKSAFFAHKLPFYCIIVYFQFVLNTFITVPEKYWYPIGYRLRVHWMWNVCNLLISWFVNPSTFRPSQW